MNDETPAAAMVNTHADLAALLEQARALQSRPPDKGRLYRAHREGGLTVSDVEWAYRAAAFVKSVVTQLEPGTLRDSGDLPDEPPLFTTRRLFQALEKRVERLERARAAGTPRADPFAHLSDAARVFTGLPLREEQPDHYRAAIVEALSRLAAVGAVAADVPFGGIAEHVNAARDVLRRAVGDE